MDDLKSELSGNFEQVNIGMMTPTLLYDVQELRKAMKVCASLLTLLVLVVQAVTRCLEKLCKSPSESGRIKYTRKVFLFHDNLKTVQQL
jgi:annexin A4